MSASAPRPFDAILFDNDGVLVDTEALYFRANREILATIGVTLDEARLLGDSVGADRWRVVRRRRCDPARPRRCGRAIVVTSMRT